MSPPYAFLKFVFINVYIIESERTVLEGGGAPPEKKQELSEDNEVRRKATKFKLQQLVCDSKFKVKVTRSKIMVWCEWSCHKD